MENWETELGFTPGDYPPGFHGQRCQGELLRCEEFDEETNKTTAILYFCWDCRRFWKFDPADFTGALKGRASQLARADTAWLKHRGADRSATVRILHPSAPAR